MRKQTIHVKSLQELAKALNLIDRAVTENEGATITIEKLNPKRSLNQNALLHAWYKDIAEFQGLEVREVEGYCKYNFGLSILRDSDAEYVADQRKISELLPYELRLLYLYDKPVTRKFSKKQMNEYLDAITMHFAAQGLVLVSPSEEQMLSYPEAQL